MSEVMASRPFSESALITGLKRSLDTFAAKVAVAAAECRAAASEASTTLMGQLDVLDPRRPDLTNRMPIAVDPLLEMRWQAREDALKAQIRQWHEKIMWKPEENIEESTNELIQPVNQAQTHENDASSQQPVDDTSEIKIVEFRFRSAKPVVYPIRPPLFDGLSACMAIEAYKTIPSACMAIEDVSIKGMPSRYQVNSMTHASDSRYVMNVYGLHNRDSAT